MKSIIKIFKAYIEQLFIYIKRPLSLFDNWAAKGRLNWVPDKWYLTFMFRSKMGYWMDWKHPKTFNEKLQWLKIHDRNPLYTKLVDKYEVRKYIAEKIGEEYLIPLLGIWDNVDDIDFDKLPDQFVLKCTHDSGSVILCKDKKNLNINKTINFLNKKLSVNYYQLARERPYKKVKPQIIAEELLTNNNHDLDDYKVFCFDGNPIYIQVDLDRFSDHKRNIYNTEWQKQPFEIKCASTSTTIAKPLVLNEILMLSKKLGKDIPHVRCDWFITNNRIYFGEMTFFHGAGFERFLPNYWDKKLGQLIDLKQINCTL